jgi:deferrochelatase/peroxidase EfeB
MNEQDDPKPSLSRRGFLARACGFAAALGAGFAVRGATDAMAALRESAGPPPEGARNMREPFFGAHQGGIVTPQQGHSYFAAIDLDTTKRDDVTGILRAWTAASAKMAGGQTLDTLGPDSGDTVGLPPARLTVTFGFGAGLFVKEGKDRFGLASRRPEALVDLPRFNGEQYVEARIGGDLSVQACADDPQVAFHAVRQLARLAEGVAQVRWAQTGFIPNFGARETPRNLMGFKDGTSNPSVDHPRELAQFVWVGGEGPDWMCGGSYLVARRVRMALEHWDQTKVEIQEQTIGRRKQSGAPLGGRNEFDQPDLDARDKDGKLLIPENSHLRLAVAANNDGARILRRPYSYNDGVNLVGERWRPWQQELEYDAGLFFVCYQRDPRTGFIKIFDRMSKQDLLNQFVTHTGGGLFACPGGIAPGDFIGQRLFQTA